MLRLRLILVLLFVACLSLATYLQPRMSAKAQAEGRSGSVLAVMLGDGRKMFANQFYAKADGYFHRGKYPSIFDRQEDRDECHIASAVESAGNHEHEEHEGPPPRDWIERFGRSFYPTEHVHTDEKDDRELLPWLRLSLELDPHQVQIYAVTAYFLRDRMGRVDEAEKLLRDGLRANPKNAEILYQLGCCFFKRDDLARANNLWIAALSSWRQFEQPKESPDLLLLRNILDGLTVVAEKSGRISLAIDYLQQLKAISPTPERIQLKIDELQAQRPVPAGP